MNSNDAKLVMLKDFYAKRVRSKKSHRSVPAQTSRFFCQTQTKKAGAITENSG